MYKLQRFLSNHKATKYYMLQMLLFIVVWGGYIVAFAKVLTTY